MSVDFEPFEEMEGDEEYKNRCLFSDISYRVCALTGFCTQNKGAITCLCINFLQFLCIFGCKVTLADYDYRLNIVVLGNTNELVNCGEHWGGGCRRH